MAGDGCKELSFSAECLRPDRLPEGTQIDPQVRNGRREPPKLARGAADCARGNEPSFTTGRIVPSLGIRHTEVRNREGLKRESRAGSSNHHPDGA